MKFIPHDYQVRAINRVIEDKHLGLFLDMGLGKTVITLTAIRDLIYDYFTVRQVLVIAPKRVAEDTWARECEKWDHLKDLKISLVTGTPAQREKALAADADVFVIGRDNVTWLSGRGVWDFDMVVIDELSSFKNPQAKRFRALKKVLPASDRVVGLTGTPSPNGLMDLWAQVYLIDRGERFGKTLGAYREKWFRPGARNGYVVYDWIPVRGAEKQIEKALSDICVSMRAEDYLTMPERIDNQIYVKLTEPQMENYKKLEREKVLQIDDHDVAAPGAAVVMGKLLQMANGCVYDDEGETVWIHDAKIEALQEIRETTDSPILVFYNYRHDQERIQKALPEARTLERPEDVAAWNAGRIPVLLAHPASVGYGLNLQEGGCTIVWFGLTWSLEQYQQANARLHRQGQTKTVIVHHLIASGTVDEQVMQALEEKNTTQAALMAALRERREAGENKP